MIGRYDFTGLVAIVVAFGTVVRRGGHALELDSVLVVVRLANSGGRSSAAFATVIAPGLNAR